jgi:uncharacterized protein (DUF2236 family)
MADACDVHGAWPSQQGGTERDTRRGSAASVRHDDPGLFDATLGELGEEFLGGRDVAQHAGGVGTTDRQGRDLATFRFGLGDQLGVGPLIFFDVGAKMHAGAEELVENDVAGPLVGLARTRDLGRQHELTPEAELRARRRRLPAVIGLHRPEGDHGVRTFGERGPEKELQLAELVAACPEPVDVVPLEEQVHPQLGAQARSGVERGRPPTQRNSRERVQVERHQASKVRVSTMPVPVICVSYSGMDAPPIVKGTAAWKYFGDFRAGLLAGQALLLQVAHPVVAAGVRDHSNYTEDPWTRLMQTAASLSVYIYGGPAGAKFEADRLRELHKAFKGVDAEGRRYSALNPHAYAWVHATLVKVPVDAQRFFGRPIPDAELGEYYAQMCDVGRLLGVRDQDMPEDWAAFERYYDEMVAGFGTNETIRTLFETIRTVPKPVRWLPGPLWIRLRPWQYRAQLFFIRGTLPPAFRDRLDLQWTDADQRRFARFCSVTRGAGSLLPTSARSTWVRTVGRLNVWLRAHPRARRLLVRR